MESMEPSHENTINREDNSPMRASIIGPSNDHYELKLENVSMVQELESLRLLYQNLETKFLERDKEFTHLQQQKQDALVENISIKEAFEEATRERDYLRNQICKSKNFFEKREEELVRENEGLKREKMEKFEFFTKNLEVIELAKDCLMMIIETIDKDGLQNFDEECEGRGEELEKNEVLREFSKELKVVLRLINTISLKFNAYKDVNKQEKRELESSVVSLTEENRDLISLLRIALVEKEAVEKNLYKLRGDNEQKRLAILQMAERGLQKVGFGFIMGSGSNEQITDNLETNSGTKSDGNECREEVISLASAVEKIMKNLRLEIAELRSSLQDSRLETEHLQSLTYRQAAKLMENKLKIKNLEDNEAKLMQKVEALLVEIKENEEDVARWREACELEVNAGKKVVQERDKLVNILKQEFEKASAALDVSNGKLKLKDELVAAAVAAREAAETSLQLADRRATGLRERIEELSKQLEESEKKRISNRRRMRYICWPFNLNPANNTAYGFRNVKRMVPEMQALLY